MQRGQWPSLARSMLISQNAHHVERALRVKRAERNVIVANGRTPVLRRHRPALPRRSTDSVLMRWIDRRSLCLNQNIAVWIDSDTIPLMQRVRLVRRSRRRRMVHR